MNPAYVTGRVDGSIENFKTLSGTLDDLLIENKGTMGGGRHRDF